MELRERRRRLLLRLRAARDELGRAVVGVGALRQQNAAGAGALCGIGLVLLGLSLLGSEQISTGTLAAVTDLIGLWWRRWRQRSAP